MSFLSTADITPSYESEFLQQQAVGFKGESQATVFHTRTTSPGTTGQAVAVAGGRTREQQGRWNKAALPFLYTPLAGMASLLTPGCPQTGSREMAGITLPQPNTPMPTLSSLPSD